MSLLESTIKTVFRAFGLEVQRLRSANTEESVLLSVLDLVRPSAVVDVGANIGQYARALRKLGYGGQIVSFEALPFLHDALVANARADRRWAVANCVALGSEAGELEMNVAANTASSSLLPMRKSHLDAAPESVYLRKERVRVARLDSVEFLPLLPPEGPLLLKIDTQGYEMNVLQGAAALLPRAEAIQIELSLIELYQGAPPMPDMVRHLDSLGFELFNIAPGFKDKRTGRLLQMDGFFLRGDGRTGGG